MQQKRLLKESGGWWPYLLPPARGVDATVLSAVRTTKTLRSSQRLKKNNNPPARLTHHMSGFPSCRLSQTKRKLTRVAMPWIGRETFRGPVRGERSLAHTGLSVGEQLRGPWGSAKEPILTIQGAGPFLATPVDETRDFNTPDQFLSGFSFYKRIHSRIPLHGQLSQCI